MKEVTKDDKCTNLPTHNPPLEDKPKPTTEIDGPPTKATQTPYQQISEIISKAKAHIATARKTKKTRMNRDDDGFLWEYHQRQQWYGIDWEFWMLQQYP